MTKRPALDYARTEGPKYKKILELKLDPYLPEKLGLEPEPFIYLNSSQQEQVVDFYIYWWDDVMGVMGAELEADIYENSESYRGMPAKEAIKAEAWNQLHVSGNRFPEGQMVLVDKKTKIPVRLTRSQVWHVPVIRGDDKKPRTWYMVSGNGNGYHWIPEMVDGETVKYENYDILYRENPVLNEDIELDIKSYALTKNHRFDVKGANRAAVVERGRFAIDRGIKHCRTFSPLNGYADWCEEKKESNPEFIPTPEEFFEENAIEIIKRGEKPKIYTAGGMHMKIGAISTKEFYPNARIDYNSGNWCTECEYF